MWIKVDNLVLNVDTGARFRIEEYDNYGNKITPGLVHEAPAGATVYEGVPMGVTSRTFIKSGSLEELEQDLYELSQLVEASGTNIRIPKTEPESQSDPVISAAYYEDDLPY